MERHRSCVAQGNRGRRVCGRQSRRLDAPLPRHGSPDGWSHDRPSGRLNPHHRRRTMKYTIKITTIVAAVALPWPALADAIQATLYKSPQCGCCEFHAAYLRENGFAIDIKETFELAQISAEAGIPPEFEGCHTILVDGYVVGGHMPAGVIKEMLSERPAIAGITLPGM